MMEVSKIQFSEAEAELMQNADLILTKNRVLEKMKMLLEGLQVKQETILKNNSIVHEVFGTSGKISRGEYYMGLPYLILDYPRRSSGQDLFFIRNMFWWGNFFSTTLHLSGQYKSLFRIHVSQSYLQLQNFSVGIHPDPWIHHFEKENYIPINSLSAKAFETICEDGEHLKIAVALPLVKWQQAEDELLEKWKLLLRLCRLIPDAV